MKSNLLAVFALFLSVSSARCINYGDFVIKRPKNISAVAFTFDDGPGISTKDILDLLDSYGAKATFFMLGSSAKQFPDKVRMVARGGHLIGNHTYSHTNFNKIPDAGKESMLAKEINETADLIQSLAGKRTKVLRMPYGISKPWISKIAKQTRHVLVNWDQGGDWIDKPRETMLKEYKESLIPGAVLLFHDGGNRRDVTVWLVKNLLEEAKRRNLRVIRLDQLLEIDLDTLRYTGVPEPAVEKKPVQPAKAKEAIFLPKSAAKNISKHAVAAPAAVKAPVQPAEMVLSSSVVKHNLVPSKTEISTAAVGISSSPQSSQTPAQISASSAAAVSVSTAAVSYSTSSAAIIVPDTGMHKVFHSTGPVNMPAKPLDIKWDTTIP